MEVHPSSFDSSEMMGLSLGATPLLMKSLDMCRRADQSGIPQLDGQGEVVFVAFPRMEGFDPCSGVMVKLQDEGGKEPFSRLTCHVGADQLGEGGVVKVHGEFLRIFLHYYTQPEFKDRMLELAKAGKSIVLTGHFVGGTTASLTALWLLCQSIASPSRVLCITFGSPLLGNGSLLLAILQESWGGSFCHVVSKFDRISRICLAQVSSVGSPEQLLARDCQRELEELFRTVLSHTERDGATEGGKHLLFWPFGSYLFCSETGAISMDNAASVLEIMHLMLRADSLIDGIKDSLSYEDIASILYEQKLKIRNSNEDGLFESSYESSVSFALQSVGINTQDKNARVCLQKARRMRLAPVLNAADLAVKLGNIHPRMAQIEWYKKRCEEEDQTGYFDAFKEGGTTRREHLVDMNLYKLGAFWDKVILMVEQNEVPQDFTRRKKWKYGSHTYMLLAEPLEIARYYQQGNHLRKGHYIEFGREKRFRVFDKWWQRNMTGDEPRQRNKFAGLTQDPVFWARVEEARDWLNSARQEIDRDRRMQLLERLNVFEEYARGMIERKEVSLDVLFPNSSYTNWATGWRELKARFQRITSGQEAEQ
ncbi:hypothetical protein MLD38_035782 [Melastoma candidum]|uniref:Uncharacterized protein n=1 Tax=Melastoma candidum TaxID=119954 RepID=A0ACB9LHM2_9MYRT|nr:hypothetical protein MLD38_035782 [Melastoma candidum]